LLCKGKDKAVPSRILIYKNNPTAGETNGTLVSSGDDTEPIESGSILVPEDGFEDGDWVKLALRCDEDFETEEADSKHAEVSINDSTSVDKWVDELCDDASKLDLAREIVRKLDPRDLAQWNYDERTLWSPLDQRSVDGTARPAKQSSSRSAVLNSYVLQRRVLLALRKDIHNRPIGKLVRRVRYYCDALLRDSL
jgi:hypothetical protein